MQVEDVLSHALPRRLSRDEFQRMGEQGFFRGTGRWCASLHHHPGDELDATRSTSYRGRGLVLGL